MSVNTEAGEGKQWQGVLHGFCLKQTRGVIAQGGSLAPQPATNGAFYKTATIFTPWRARLQMSGAGLDWYDHNNY